MNILVLYGLAEKEPRKTILDSLYCFQNYDEKNIYYYLNILKHEKIWKKFTFPKMDGIIIHYSMISMRYDQEYWKKNKEELIEFVKRHQCSKAIIPQDEYNYNGDVRDFIKQSGINYIFTCALEEDYEKLYPKCQVGEVVITTVFTGYVDEVTIKTIEQRGGIKKNREYDIGYRARQLPFWLGRHGQLKTQLADAFLKHLDGRSDIKYDIKNTGLQGEHTFNGYDWIDFLLNCRTMLGCLGGSGLLDVDGSIFKKVEEYCNIHPTAEFNEVERECFPGLDNYIHLYALSPRHFECAITKTCQLLVEVVYQGVFRPNIDFIEIKKDFSNMDSVIDKVKDVEYCERIADNCYQHVIKSGEYTYHCFTLKIINVMFQGIYKKTRVYRKFVIIMYLHELNEKFSKKVKCIYVNSLNLIRNTIINSLNLISRLIGIKVKVGNNDLKEFIAHRWYCFMESDFLKPLKSTKLYQKGKIILLKLYSIFNRKKD